MFRFTIRDVLWLTVVVAVALSLAIGWWRVLRLADSSAGPAGRPGREGCI